MLRGLGLGDLKERGGETIGEVMRVFLATATATAISVESHSQNHHGHSQPKNGEMNKSTRDRNGQIIAQTEAINDLFVSVNASSMSLFTRSHIQSICTP